MKYAVLFPGQGSQSVGMLRDLGQELPIVRETLKEADRHLGWRLSELVEQGPVEELNRTERTQPCLLAAGVAVWRAWQQRLDVSPVAMAGHSLGEYSALVAAGSLEFGAALRLVELRGQLMQQAVPDGTGGMAAIIGLDDAAVESFCAACTSGVLEPVNFNAPGQVVVAGHSAALDWVEANAKAAGARMVVRLPVSVPSHCSLMREAAQRFAEQLEKEDIRLPSIPVLHNLDAQQRDTTAGIRAALKDQMHRPVRWTQTVQALTAMGAGVFLECGPGKVLSGLNKRIAKLPGTALEDPAAWGNVLHEITGVSQ